MPHNVAEPNDSRFSHIQSPLVQSPLRQESESPLEPSHPPSLEDFEETVGSSSKDEPQLESKTEEKPYTRQFTLTHNRALDQKPS